MANQGKEIHSPLPALEDEALQYDFLLVEPQDDHVSVDAFLCKHGHSSEKCVQSDDIPCKLGDINYGPGLEQHQLKARDVAEIQPSQTEVGNSPNGLSSSCEDYLLDGEVVEYSVEVDHKPSTELQKSVLVNHTQADNPGGNGAPQKSGSSGTTDHANNSEPDGMFSCTGDSDKSLNNSWFKYTEEDVSSNSNENIQLLRQQMPCRYIPKHENKDSSPPRQLVVKESTLQIDASPIKSPVEACGTDNNDAKRQRKPPKRFIDELSPSKSSLKKKEGFAPSSKGKYSSGGALKHQNKKPKAESFSLEDPISFAIQVPFGPLVPNVSDSYQDPPAKVKMESRNLKPSLPNKRKVLIKSRKEIPVSDADTETESESEFEIESESDTQTESESEEDYFKLAKYKDSDGGHRKNHVLWSVSEVKMLIDGVSEHGVGRWSRIKKDYFPSSVHRSPVDLKDKWRNLLKACCVLKGGKEGKRNLAWRPLPKAILRRVNELSSIHPYPRARRAKS